MSDNLQYNFTTSQFFLMPTSTTVPRMQSGRRFRAIMSIKSPSCQQARDVWNIPTQTFTQVGLTAIRIDQSRSSLKLSVHTFHRFTMTACPAGHQHTAFNPMFHFLCHPAADANPNSGTVLPCVLAVMRVSMKPRTTVATSMSCSWTKIRNEGIDKGFCGRVCNHIGGTEQYCHRAYDTTISDC